jgi:hypothetical protein
LAPTSTLGGEQEIELFIWCSYVVKENSKHFIYLRLPVLVNLSIHNVMMNVAMYICICSVLGTVLIVVGLYAFLWGKGKELKLAAGAAAAQKQEQQGGV